MIKLTAPNGNLIEVRPDAIDEISVNDGTFEHGNSILLIGGQRQAVRETVQEIDALLTRAEGRT